MIRILIAERNLSATSSLSLRVNHGQASAYSHRDQQRPTEPAVPYSGASERLRDSDGDRRRIRSRGLRLKQTRARGGTTTLNRNSPGATRPAKIPDPLAIPARSPACFRERFTRFFRAVNTARETTGRPRQRSVAAVCSRWRDQLSLLGTT
jgi:hypothetical protein